MSTKDKIEEIILNNLEELNDNEPLEGHFERFEAKLKLQYGVESSCSCCICVAFNKPGIYLFFE